MTGPIRLFDWCSVTTRFVFFTGKGGVGKTTVASGVAVALADSGRRVLLVSTDPASNLGDVFEMHPGEHPGPAPGVAGLDLMDLDPHVAADEYRSRVIGPYRGVLPDAELVAWEEKLAGACTVEVAAFDTFARLLADESVVGAYDHVVFDTAPTGHTLRLLSLPAAWSEYLGANPDATSCLGPLGGLQDHRPIYAGAVAVLRDPAVTMLALVTRPDRRALAVAADAARELADLGITNQRLIVNGVLVDPLDGDAIAQSFAAMQRVALASMPSPLEVLDAAMVPLATIDLVGVAALRRIVAGDVGTVDASAGAEGHREGRGRQDDRGVADRIGSRSPRPSRPPGHHGPRRSRCRAGSCVSLVDDERRGPRGSDTPLCRGTARGRSSEWARRRPDGVVGGGPAFAVLTRGCGVPGVPPAPSPRPRPVRRDRHRAHGAHAAVAGRDRVVPPSGDARSAPQRPRGDPSDVAAGSGVHEVVARDAARVHTGERGRGAPGRLAPCRDRAAWVGGQRGAVRLGHA